MPTYYFSLALASAERQQKLDLGTLVDILTSPPCVQLWVLDDCFFFFSSIQLFLAETFRERREENARDVICKGPTFKVIFGVFCRA